MTVLEKYVEGCLLLASSQSMKVIFFPLWRLLGDFFKHGENIICSVVKNEYDIASYAEDNDILTIFFPYRC